MKVCNLFSGSELSRSMEIADMKISRMENTDMKVSRLEDKGFKIGLPEAAGMKIRLLKGKGGRIVPVEHSICVYVNEILTFEMVCTPSELVEMILGRLLTEGIIKCIDDLDSVNISEDGREAQVYLKDTVSQCRRDPEPVKPVKYSSQQVFLLAERLTEGTPLHLSTSGVHSCFLAVGDRLLYSCEDIGRHNAVDKAIGHALLEGVDLTQAVLYTSGRAPADMIMKLIRAEIPVFIAKGAPTDAAVEMAEKYNLTLACFARSDQFIVFAGEIESA